MDGLPSRLFLLRFPTLLRGRDRSAPEVVASDSLGSGRAGGFDWGKGKGGKLEDDEATSPGADEAAASECFPGCLLPSLCGDCICCGLGFGTHRFGFGHHAGL